MVIDIEHVKWLLVFAFFGIFFPRLGFLLTAIGIFIWLSN